jgi:hypothetical protein
MSGKAPVDFLRSRHHFKSLKCYEKFSFSAKQGEVEYTGACFKARIIDYRKMNVKIFEVLS